MTTEDGDVTEHGPPQPRVLGDRYELRRRLGSGGSGAVWEAHDRALDRPVAVKLLHADLADDPAAEARFRTEATAAARITHPNAVLIHDVGRDTGADYLVMELVLGTSLATLLQHGRLPADEAATLATMVASALGSAHRAGIVHRDVKPGNVLVTEEGRAKLADFGIARALGELTARLTRTGTVLGTARYLAPEQLRDDPIDARADVYSLGLVLHEVLTGTPPFGEGGAVEVAARRLNVDLPVVSEVVPEVPVELAEVVDWATRRDPRQRPEDGDVLAAALRPFASESAEHALGRRVVTASHTGSLGAASEPAPALPMTPPGARQPRTEALPTNPDAAAETTRAVGVASSAPPAAAAPAPAPATSTASGRRGGTGPAARWLVVGALVVTTAAVGIGVLTSGGDQPPRTETEQEPVTTEDEDVTDGPEGSLEIVESGDHDPLGDGEERPDDVGLAIDGDRDTFWPTQTYTTADLGGLKDGVGIWVRVEAEEIDAVSLALSAAEGELELWAGDGPPDRSAPPADWGELIGRGTITGTDVQFPLADRQVEGDTLLLWFTELPQAGGGFRAEVREIRIEGS